MAPQWNDVPRFRFRFSLLTAMLLITIGILALVLMLQWRELLSLQSEVRQLRSEVGRLSIHDPSKIHAVQLQTADKLFWKWRVWIPEGEAAFVRFVWDEIPRTGYPAARGTRLDSGEHWITLRAARELDDGPWMATLETDTGIAVRIIPDTAAWFVWPSRTTAANGVAFDTVAEKRHDKNFLLWRERAGQSTTLEELNKSDALLPGVIVWLERQ